MKTPIRLALTVLAFLGVSVGAPRAQAYDQNFPDGDYPGQNTAEGGLALRQTLRFYPQPAPPGLNNTAIGFHALTGNTDGHRNTATGAFALENNTAGGDNTATGAFALENNTTGFRNEAIGVRALINNTTGSDNIAIGDSTLLHNTTGFDNTAIGAKALIRNTTGRVNIALGLNAGSGVTTADDVICIGAAGADVSHSCYIGNIFNQSCPSGLAVFVNSDGKLGTTMSSRRFKEDIKPMDKASQAILALQPMTFRYKKDFDPTGTAQFGLVAEDVEKVNPDLVVHDKAGKPYSVRYEQVNAMLLNEFLKEHKTVQDLKSAAAKQEATIVRQQKQIEALTAGLQKVSAQLEVHKPAPQTVLNSQ
jgi:hypothetical protein